MKNILIEATSETPYVEMNFSNGSFIFRGKSYPENVHDFYNEILDALKVYAQNPASSTVLDFEWTYFNTATLKTIVQIILELKNLPNSASALKINWICRKDDDLMIEKGEELKALLHVDFSLKMSV